MVVRVPLKLLVNLGLPRREGGYLDLRHIDEPLERAAAATAKEFEIRADGVTNENKVAALRRDRVLQVHVEVALVPEDAERRR